MDTDYWARAPGYRCGVHELSQCSIRMNGSTLRESRGLRRMSGLTNSIKHRTIQLDFANRPFPPPGMPELELFSGPKFAHSQTRATGYLTWYFLIEGA